MGSHCVSAILRAAGLPDLKGLFTRRAKSSADNSNNNSRAMSSANLSLHQAGLLSARGGSGDMTGRGSEESQGSSHRNLRGRASFSSAVTAALSSDSTKNNTPSPSRGVHNSRSNLGTPAESPRLAPFSPRLLPFSEEKKEDLLPSPSKQPLNMLNVSTKQGLAD